MVPQTVLIAVDGSERASSVFSAGAGFARALRARTVVCRVITIPPDFPPAAATTTADPLPAYLEREAREGLTGLIAGAPDLQCELHVVQAAQPWRAILELSEAVHATLIVIGSHGYHGWDRILGTTAARVANLADRNVLVVHGAPSPSGPTVVGTSGR